MVDPDNDKQAPDPAVGNLAGRRSSPTDETIIHSSAPTADGTKAPPSDTLNRVSDIASKVVGKELGDFRVLRRLGAGAMAEVFLAEQLSLKRQVALKILKPELLADSDDTHLKRFTQEAMAAANLNHPHIVQVYAIGEYENWHFIAQEYASGLTLANWLRKSGPPEPLRAMHVLIQVANALQAASEAGIVHRDIKPENILLSKKLDAKVTDFGLAQLSRTEDRVQLTQVGMTMGTPLYMSPEQVGGKALDHRSDIYSLGVTAYQLLAGRPPFHGESALSVAVQHLNATPEPLRRARPDLPVALCQIVEKMMAKRPDDRYQHASDVVEDLTNLGAAMKRDPVTAGKRGLEAFTVARRGPQGKWPFQLDRFFQWSGRRHTLALGTLSLCVFAASLGAGWLSHPANPFDAPAPTQKTPKKDSSWEQWVNAIFSGDPNAYEAVRARYPNSQEAVSATIRLAIIRLSERDFEGARELFEELSYADGETERINGRTGLALVAAFEKDIDEFRKQLASVENIQQAHPDLQRLLLGMREHRGVNPEVRTLLDENFPEDEWSEMEDGPSNPQSSPDT